MIVRNKSKKVVVFKSIGLPPLRVFPGFNEIPEGLDQYLINNPAASAHAKKKLEFTEKSKLKSDDVKNAELAKIKNDELNKAKKIIKVQDQDLKSSNAEIKKLNKKIKSLMKRIEGLEKDRR